MGLEATLLLSVIAWLCCALPVAVLIGYCALSEERPSDPRDEAPERTVHASAA